MKTEEDEAFDELAKRQGDWGGGFKAKQAMAADKLQEPTDIAELVQGMEVSIDVSTGDHDSGNRLFGMVTLAQESQGSKHGLILLVQDPEPNFKPAQEPVQQEALYGMNQDDWKDVVAAIVKVRDGRGIYLGCRPADVFQDWFLALGTAKVKEKNG